MFLYYNHFIIKIFYNHFNCHYANSVLYSSQNFKFDSFWYLNHYYQNLDPYIFLFSCLNYNLFFQFYILIFINQYFQS